MDGKAIDQAVTFLMWTTIVGVALLVLGIGVGGYYLGRRSGLATCAELTR